MQRWRFSLMRHTKIEILRTDPRIVDLVNSVTIRTGRGNHYYRKSDGHQISLICEIVWLHSCSRGVAIRAVNLLLGREPKQPRPREDPIALIPAPT
jgi:hypothetical protein